MQNTKTAESFITDEALREQKIKDSQSIELIAHKVSRLATDMGALAVAQSRMAETLTALVRIEERQQTTSSRLDELGRVAMEKEVRLRTLEIAMPDNIDKRLSSIEEKMPGLVESRLWVICSMIGIIGLVGTAIMKGVFR